MRLPRNQLIQGPCLAYATLTPSESLSFRFRLAGLRSIHYIHRTAHHSWAQTHASCCNHVCRSVSALVWVAVEGNGAGSQFRCLEVQGQVYPFFQFINVHTVCTTRHGSLTLIQAEIVTFNLCLTLCVKMSCSCCC